MSLIMTSEGWKQLSPKCENHVYERQSFNFKDQKWEKDNDLNARLRHVDTVDCLPSPAKERNAYEGKFPSKDLCVYINTVKNNLKFFDDGLRMVYDRPSRIVDTDNMEAVHPIPNPPEGF